MLKWVAAVLCCHGHGLGYALDVSGAEAEAFAEGGATVVGRIEGLFTIGAL